MVNRQYNYLGVAGLGILLTTAGLVVGQNMPQPRGSLDAMTVITPPPNVAATSPALATTLPANHATTTPTIPGHPVGMQTIKTGALRVLISQGTKDGPSIAADPVTVELFAKGKVIKTIDATVGDKGVLEIHDLPLDVPFQPVVTVTHAGTQQEVVGATMHQLQPAIEMDMKVYEALAEKPAWTIGIRQVDAVAVTTDDGGKLASGVALRLTELIGGFNPTDRAWAGESGPTGGKSIFSIPLPTGVTNVQFGSGMAEAGAKFENGMVTRGKTMLPGSTEYIFAYTVPVKEGHATLTFTAPTDTTLFAVYAPPGSKVEKCTGVEAAKAAGTHGELGSQLLKAKSVKSGQVATIELSGIKVPPPPPPPTTQFSDTQMPAVHPTATTKPESK